jgi:uncharacterized protein (TIGR02452 family)
MYNYIRKIYNDNKMLFTYGYLKHTPFYNSEKYFHESDFIEYFLDNTPVINVIPVDCLDVTKYLKSNGYNPVVLNMADVNFPGGGIELGGYAQEESLFCRSNYFKTLNVETGFYPINKEECIYSPNVFINRDSKLNLSKTPFYVSFIAVAAIKEPKLINNKFSSEDYNLTLKKIEVMFQVASFKKHDSLILSAFGCGAYKNSKKDIVEIFNNCIKKYGHLFKFIIFAILPKDAMNNRYILKESDDDCNYEFFKKNISPIYDQKITEKFRLFDFDFTTFL